MPILLSHEDLKIKLGLDKDIQLLRFDYHTEPGKELLEIILIGEPIDIKIINSSNKRCDHRWVTPGLERNCPNCTSEDIEEEGH